MSNDYRGTLELIYERFGRIQLLSISKAAEFLGVDRRTLEKSDIPKKQIGRRMFISATTLAKWLS